MGSIEDTMHQFERKELNQVFRVSDGWKEVPPVNSATTGGIHVFKRDLWGGRSEHATIIVLYEAIVNEEKIASICTRYQNGQEKNKIVLLVSKNADVDLVPKDIGVITMSSFGYDAGKLVWLTKKKNAKKFTSELSVPTAS